MDVEIHDRNALEAMRRDGVARGDSGVVEEAKAHRRRAFGMMARRAHGDESIVYLSANDLVHSLARAAYGIIGRFKRAWTHGRVAVETGVPVARRGLLKPLDVGLGMNTQGHFARAFFGLTANQRHKLFVFENALDNAHTIRTFGMTGSIVVIEPGSMR
jgi:hypothetical protein